MQPDVQLHVSGQIFGGWTQIEVNLSMATIAGSFSLELTERWAEQTEPRPIRPGEPCQVFVNDQLVITGYVDDVASKYGATEHSDYSSRPGQDR